MRKTLRSKRHTVLVDLLIKKRQASGITQTELADSLDEYQSFVALLESGQRRIDVVELIELSEILNFDPVEIIMRVKAEKD